MCKKEEFNALGCIKNEKLTRLLLLDRAKDKLNRVALREWERERERERVWKAIFKPNHTHKRKINKLSTYIFIFPLAMFSRKLCKYGRRCVWGSEEHGKSIENMHKVWMTLIWFVHDGSEKFKDFREQKSHESSSSNL